MPSILKTVTVVILKFQTGILLKPLKIDYFTHWFKEEYIARLEVDSSFKYKLMGGFFSLEDILNSPKVTKQIDSVSNLGQENLLELLAQQTELLENLLTRTNAIDARTQNIETAVSEIQKNISSICAKISDYQSLLNIRLLPCFLTIGYKKPF